MDRTCCTCGTVTLEDLIHYVMGCFLCWLLGVAGLILKKFLLRETLQDLACALRARTAAGSHIQLSISTLSCSRPELHRFGESGKTTRLMSRRTAYTYVLVWNFARAADPCDAASASACTHMHVIGSSHLRVKGRSHSVEERISTHSSCDIGYSADAKRATDCATLSSLLQLEQHPELQNVERLKKDSAQASKKCQ